MPAEEKDKESLQDLLRDLLASTTPEAAAAPTQEEQETTEGSEVPASPRQGPAEEKTPEGSEGDPPPPALEVEIVPPEIAAPPGSLEAAPGRATAPQAPARPEAKIEQTLLEGKIEIRVAPPVAPARLSLLERGLRERDGVLWLGTWGKPKEGTTLSLQLKVPLTAAQLFEGAASVEGVALAKAGKVWQIRVSLASEGSETPRAEVLPSVAPPEPAPQRPGPTEPGPALAPTEAPGQVRAGQVDLEVSPIASLEALNRLERLLSSLGCRLTNVLSLDGVSTVLVTLEGVDRETLTRKLQEKVSGIQVEVSQGRLVARLPEEW